jgi:hypothetical protein
MGLLKKHGRPLLLLPKDKTSAAATFALYPAQTAKARLIRACLQRSARLGLPIGPRVELRLAANDQLVHFLLSCVRSTNSAGQHAFEVPTFGILAGNPASPAQRFLILLFDQRQQPVAVVKTGLNIEARGLVEREREFLQRAPANTRALPRLRGAFHNDRIDAFAVDFVPGDSPNPTDRPHVAELLSAWLDTNKISRLSDFAEWKALENAVPTDVRAEIGLDRLRDHVVRPCLYHGDFAPWNIKVAPDTGKWTVLDWERGQIAGIPGWDWFHFYLQNAILVERLNSHDLVHRAEDILQAAEFQTYARLAQIVGIEGALMAAYLMHIARVINPSEGREAAEQLWKDLTSSAH